MLFACSAVFFALGAFILTRVRSHHVPEADEEIVLDIMPALG